MGGLFENAESVAGDREESATLPSTRAVLSQTLPDHIRPCKASDSQPRESWLCGQLCAPGTHPQVRASRKKKFAKGGGRGDKNQEAADQLETTEERQD